MPIRIRASERTSRPKMLSSARRQKGTAGVRGKPAGMIDLGAPRTRQGSCYQYILDVGWFDMWVSRDAESSERSARTQHALRSEDSASRLTNAHHTSASSR